MKMLKLLSFLMVTSMLTMSMEFPTEVTSKINLMEEKPGTVVKTANRSTVVDVVEEEPVLTAYLAMPASSIMNVKVFDVKGNLVIEKQVSIDEFLSKSKKASLPEGSTFVMFHEHTAYYFMETGVVQ